jgi:hypothetical protein
MLRFCVAAAAAAAAAFRSKKSSPIHHPTPVTCSVAVVGDTVDADREGQLLSSTDGGETAATISSIGSNRDGAAGTAASSSSQPQMTSSGIASADGLSSEYSANWR